MSERIVAERPRIAAPQLVDAKAKPWHDGRGDGATSCQGLVLASTSCGSLRRIMARPLEHDLLFGRLEVVVVPELLAGDDLGHVLDPARRRKPVHLELAAEPGDVEIGHLAGHRVDAEAGDLAADIDRPVIHRVAEVLAGVAEDDHAAALHHEAAERPGPAADDDGAALHVD